ncbi:MAG TPA: patatin-like phospholipase family protein, partial [Flavisolibacter sp.]|nr:patatin-like phospholipase family protein [Flavisolibacter sp.]
KNYISHLQPEKNSTGRSLIHSEWFLDSFYRVRRCRDVSHYSQELMENIFKRHHFAAVISIFIVYLFLLLVGFFIDYPFFQFPAGASVTLLFAILIGVTGAIVYFFQSWSVPALIFFILILNAFYQVEWIDPRNKAYGLNYGNEHTYPSYTQRNIDSIAGSASAGGDKKNMETILGNWRAAQGEEKPLLVVVTTSGGGNRSATFTMNVLQRLDSLTGGTMMKKTFLFTGASGGMIGATYFRELYRQRLTNLALRLQSTDYVDNIASDLLNPTFTSFVSRDVFAPERKFSVGPYSYLRDRGLAFEQALNQNTDKVLDKKLGDYKKDEEAATIPMMLYHTVITRDGKKMLICTQPMRFMMESVRDSGTSKPAADAIDFTTFFARQDPYNLRMLTVLRMNATFPVVLPNVWMPTEPVIDVMDGGLRDNFGLETSLRFLSHMQNWVLENTRGVLLVQIRDRMDGGWENPYAYDDLMQNATKPFFLLQHNWYKMMEYFQKDMTTYFFNNSRFPVHNITFQYIPRKEENKAALSFHLTKQEKLDIAGSLQSEHNQKSFSRVLELFAQKD